MLTGLKHACNMLIRRFKWLSNSKGCYSFQSLKFEKVYEFLTNKTFKIVWSVLKVEK